MLALQLVIGVGIAPSVSASGLFGRGDVQIAAETQQPHQPGAREAIQLKIARAFWRDHPMKPKSSAQLGAIACVAFAFLATSAYGQGGGYYYGEGYRGEGYRGGGYPYGPPVRCLSSDGVNASLANRGLYPIALVGQSPDGQVLYMRVSQGPQVFIATVDGCTGRVLRMQGDYG
jgi:hypothetical protein